MLMEITKAEYLKEITKPALFIKGDKVVLLEDLFEGVHILVDTTKELTPKPAPAEPKAKAAPKKRKPQNEVKAEILKAWNNGENKIMKVCEMTGYSYKTVRNYIPISPEG